MVLTRSLTKKLLQEENDETPKYRKRKSIISESSVDSSDSDFIFRETESESDNDTVSSVGSGDSFKTPPPKRPRYKQLNDSINILSVRRPRRKNKKPVRNNKNKKFEPSVKNITTISDLIKCGLEWKLFENENNPELNFTHIEYDRIFQIVPELMKLDDMVGMTDLKSCITEQILYFVQNLQGNEMMNIVITGDPGTGKTTIAKILGSIYCKLGILESRVEEESEEATEEEEKVDEHGKRYRTIFINFEDIDKEAEKSQEFPFKVLGRADLIGRYLGHTAMKTKKALESCKGGVVFIDEAYSIGQSENDSDSYSKECINTINQFLSENRDIICILAGYEKEIESQIFSTNPGMDRRFPWRFKMDVYNSNDLKDIFLLCVYKDEWVLNFDENDPKNKKKLISYFSEKDFKNNGGDCEFLFNRCKIEHGKRIFYLEETEKKKQRFCLSLDDIHNGFESYKKAKEKQKSKSLGKDVQFGMYI